jgi:hypothetical protein
MMLTAVYSDKAAEGVFCNGRSCFTGSIIGSTSWPISNVLAAGTVLLASQLRLPRKYAPTAVTGFVVISK